MLQEREFEPLGAERTQRVDVRVIAATNRDLKQMVTEGQVPRGPLLPAERHPDRDPAAARAPRGHPRCLIDHFVEKHRQRTGKRIEKLEDDVIEALSNTSWPGNVRELENTIERAVVLATGPVITRGGHLVARRIVSAFARASIDASASEPGVGGARNDQAGTRAVWRGEEGGCRADGHQSARLELLPRQIPHRLIPCVYAIRVEFTGPVISPHDHLPNYGVIAGTPPQ